jgi:hypothetical protein
LSKILITCRNIRKIYILVKEKVLREERYGKIDFQTQKKPRGPKHDSQNRIRSPITEGDWLCYARHYKCANIYVIYVIAVSLSIQIDVLTPNYWCNSHACWCTRVHYPRRSCYILGHACCQCRVILACVFVVHWQKNGSSIFLWKYYPVRKLFNFRTESYIYAEK